MNELESQIVNAAIQFIASLAGQIMESATATDAQKQAMLNALSSAVDAEVAKVKTEQLTKAQEMQTVLDAQAAPKVTLD